MEVNLKEGFYRSMRRFTEAYHFGSVLSQMEFFMLAVPHKYRLEKELPFYFDDFILADYNYLLKKLSEIEAPIENCTTEICRSFAENDVQSVDFALSQD